MKLTISKGPNATSDNWGAVQYIPGMGAKRSMTIFMERPCEIEIEPAKEAMALKNIDRLAAQGIIVVEGRSTEAKIEHKTEAKQETSAMNSPADALADALRRALEGAVSEDRVRSIVQDQLNQALAAVPTVRIEIKRENMKPVQIEGLHHPMFSKLVRMASCRGANGYVPNIWIAGEKSSGKSHAGRALALALDLPFYLMGTLAMAHEVLGFVDGNGKYHSTAFVDCFINGGVIQMDEIDSYEAHPCLSLNAPLANNYMTLPDGRFVERHKDCIVIGGANTWGMGATNEYIGRNKLDAAFLSRFPAKLTWNIDPALEQAFSGNVRWAERVQAARARAKAAGLKIGIDTRHTAAGAAFIAGGFTEDEAADLTYLAGLTDEQRKMIEGV